MLNAVVLHIVVCSTDRHIITGLAEIFTFSLPGFLSTDSPEIRSMNFTEKYLVEKQLNSK